MIGACLGSLWFLVVCQVRTENERLGKDVLAEIELNRASGLFSFLPTQFGPQYADLTREQSRIFGRPDESGDSAEISCKGISNPFGMEVDTRKALPRKRQGGHRFIGEA
jgi:hypothetical protein